MVKVQSLVYFCEECGCPHLDPDEIMTVGDKEFCTDCIDYFEFIQHPTYGVLVIPKSMLPSLAIY